MSADSLPTARAFSSTRTPSRAFTTNPQSPSIMGMVGSTLRSGNYQVLWGAAFVGWNVKWVRGYTSTAELRQAAERGEIDMTHFRASCGHRVSAQDGQIYDRQPAGHDEGRQAGPRPILGDAPIISDLVKGKINDPLAQKAFDYGENVSQVGMWLALPPRTPDDIVATYVKAFEATLERSGLSGRFRQDRSGLAGREQGRPGTLVRRAREGLAGDPRLHPGRVEAAGVRFNELACRLQY